jgi:hypothetical protein
MSYLIYVAVFGMVVTLFLWLRDARIFFRTGLPGYRKAAYQGVAYGGFASLGAAITLTMPDFELLGLGFILAALYLQGNIVREKVWKNENTLMRFLGTVSRQRPNTK